VGFGVGVVAHFAEKRPELLEAMLAPSERTGGAVLSGQNSSWFNNASGFLDILLHAAPASIQRMLDAVNVAKAKSGWLDSLKKGGTAASGCRSRRGDCRERTRWEKWHANFGSDFPSNQYLHDRNIFVTTASGATRACDERASSQR
jgi:hypothetical protein